MVGSSKPHVLKLSAEKLLNEFHYLQQYMGSILSEINSNRHGIRSTFQTLSAIAATDLTQLDNLIEFDIALTKINTYIEMAYLNEVEEHAVRFNHITRIHSLLFKLHLNKLLIIQSIVIHNEAPVLNSLPPEIGLLRQLKHLNASQVGLKKFPKEISLLTHLQTLNLAQNSLTEFPKEMGALTQLTVLNIEGNPFKKIPENLKKFIQIK